MRRLLIRPGAIGDCILSFPALEYLTTEETEIWISTPVVPLVSFSKRTHSIGSTGLDLVGIEGVSIPSRLRERLRSFDEIVSWYGTNRPPFREALLGLGLSCTFHPALPPPGSVIHATDFFARQVGAWGKERDGFVSQIAVPAAEPRGTVVIHPFSGSARKNWPLPLFMDLAARLPYPVEWTAGPEEELPGAVRFANLAELAHWLAGARLFIGNDAGITHLAAAVGVPTLALFGETDPRVWAPRGSYVRVLRSNPLADLSVDAVLAAI